MKALASGKLKGTKVVEPVKEKELMLLDGKSGFDFRTAKK